jgi:DNA replication protein DnaC
VVGFSYILYHSYKCFSSFGDSLHRLAHYKKGAEKEIVIKGEPGTGKTILTLQLAMVYVFLR